MKSLNIKDIFVAVNMTNEDWETSTSAPIMLTGLYLQDPEHFKSLIPVLHRYFLACCWKIEHLIPQKALRDGLRGAEKWIDGKITDEEFRRLEWSAEAEAFAFENPDTAEEQKELEDLIDSVEFLKDTSYETAHYIMKKAAYFVDTAMVYPTINHAPYVESLCTSRFLCPDLLREYLQPNFKENPHTGSLDIVATKEQKIN